MFKIIATYFLLQTSVENCNVSALDNMFRTPLHWAAVLGKYRERSGSVVECLTRDRGAPGLSLTGFTVLCP